MQAGAFGSGPGEIVDGRYRIESVLGVGGFGAVYRATQLNLGRAVAVKVLHAGLLSTDSTLARFQREAELAQRLKHPNTVRLFDFGRTAHGAPFIVWELLEGTPLDALIRDQGALPPARVARIASQILKSLMEAHQLGIVHRDIKPSNVFVCDFSGEPDFVKVLDFGVAKTLLQDGGAVTGDGQMVGTPSYMAPEQVRGHDVGPSADLYSLGLVMSEMLSGRAVYVGRSVVDVFMAQASPDPPPVPPEVSSGPLGPIVTRATAKSPAERYASAQQMLADLTARSHGLAETSSGTLVMRSVPDPGTVPPAFVVAQSGAPTSTPTIPSATEPARSRAMPLLLVGLGGLLALGAVGALGIAWFVGRESATSEPGSSSKPRVVHLDKGDPVHRGNDFGNLSEVGIQRAIEPLGWKPDGALTTNFEGAFTSRRQSIAKGNAKGAITLYRFDDANEAEKMALVARQQAGSKVVRKGTALIVVWVHEDEHAADKLIQALLRAAE